mmetsp:Transcript_57038/g.118076  ORF Transcript_57038/g.118076 Transcript_57038/m.118076 type:complete len:110 (-) Transcript_57038:376-705(-)
MAPQSDRKDVACAMVMSMSSQLHSVANQGSLTLGASLVQMPGPVRCVPRLLIVARTKTLQLQETQAWPTCGLEGFALLSSMLVNMEAGESAVRTRELQVESRAASWKSP